jgi:NADPH:quinone reductase-like Zn-dependent oxidoreductase
MKAIVYQRYGSPDVLELMDVATPTPKDDEVLVRVRATTVTSGDWRARSLILPAGFGLLGRLVFGVTSPRQPILGTELAGDVVAAGKNVRAFKVGDAVFAFTGASMGCHAEYRCIRETAAIALKPANISYEEAAALSFGGTTVLDFFRRGEVKKGERVLVNGASGGVGTAAVQIAKHMGAHVTAVCSAANADLVRSLGADDIVDYAKEDFSKSGKHYDVIVDTVGTAPYARCAASLRKGGRLLLVLAPLSGLFSGVRAALDGKRVVAGPASEKPEDLRTLAELASSGAFKPFIDKTFAFEQMADAHRVVDSGRKRGNVVVTIALRALTASTLP